MQQRENNEIDLVHLFKAIWQRAIGILFVSLVCGALAFGGTLALISPKYSAAATMYVNNSSFSFGSTSFSISSGELSAANTLVGVYSEILKSRTTLEQVIEESKVPYSYTALRDMISVGSTSGSGIFTVTVESESPTEAELIANTVAKILPDRIADIVDGASVRIVDYAIVPAHRSSPNYVKNTVLGLLAGFMLSAGLVAVKDILSGQDGAVISSSDDLKACYPDIPVLATIPDMRKVSKKGYGYSSYYAADPEKKGGK